MTKTKTQKPIRVAVFRTAAEADVAVASLLEQGFEREELAVLCPEQLKPHFEALSTPLQEGGQAAESAMAGGAVGAVLGGLVGAAGLALTGGTGLFVAGGALGAAAAGAATGGFLGAMASRGLEPEVVDFYEQALRRGRILVAVEPHDAERLAEAERALAAAGAEPVELPKG